MHPEAVELEISASFSGPVPHPAFLDAYERIVPGSAGRIIETFTSEVAHRRARENREEARLDRGQNLGFGLAVMFLLAAVGLSLMGYPTQGVVLGSVDIVALVVVFVLRRLPGANDDL